MPNVHHGDGLPRIVNLVPHPVIALADAPALTPANFRHPGQPGFLTSDPNHGGLGLVAEAELRALFTPEHGWRVLALHPARFQTRSPLGQVPAVAGCLERTTP